MRQFLAPIAVVATLLSAPAMATIYPLGTLTTTSTQTKFLTASNTTDYFTFSLPTTENVFGTVANIPLAGLFDIAALSAELYSGTILNTPLSFIGTIADGQSVTFANLTSGAYTVKVSGLPTGALGGLYNLTLVPQSAAPVPGPAGLLVAGAGVAAVAFRRRRAAKKAAKAIA